MERDRERKRDEKKEGNRVREKERHGKKLLRVRQDVLLSHDQPSPKRPWLHKSE